MHPPSGQSIEHAFIVSLPKIQRPYFTVLYLMPACDLSATHKVLQLSNADGVAQEVISTYQASFLPHLLTQPALQ
jgi:hypothetical protein